MTKAQIKQFLLRAHEDAGPAYGDYDSYGNAIQGAYDELLKKLGLADKWMTSLETDENGYVCNVNVLPRVEETTIPDVATWDDPSMEPVNVEECTAFWLAFQKNGKP